MRAQNYTTILLTVARIATKTGAALAIRQAAGLSQREMADAVGVTQAALGRWERGERKPTGEAGMAYGLLLVNLRDQVEELGEEFQAVTA